MEENVTRPGTKEFREAWIRLAREGKCDTIGGLQYCRVVADWLQDGRPEPIDKFIITHSNIGPSRAR